MSDDPRQAADDPFDDLLMRRVADGDSGAFETLIRHHMRRALAIAQGVMGNPHDADEIAQEAFMRVWQHADHWSPGRARFSTWLYRIVLNLCLDRRRKMRWAPLEEAGELPDLATPSAVDGLIQTENRRAVTAALDEIPVRQRMAIALFYFEGLSGKAAAAAMEIKVSAFEQLLLRARRAVRARLVADGFAGREENR